jgi:NAD-dependent deacetylase
MNIVILTGAGISAESGIRTFRDANGLWEDHAIEDVATPEAFECNPELVHRFYNARRKQLLEPTLKPNAAHLALAELEQKWPDNLLLITQNVDNLHARAGSKKLLHMHGELLKVRCNLTNKVYDWASDLDSSAVCECCKKTASLRPHIVWFGEMPLQMDFIYDRLDECDLFVSIGTSGHVYPAAGFVSHVRENGRDAQTIEINLDGTQNFSQFKTVIRGAASTEVPKFVAEILKLKGS